MSLAATLPYYNHGVFKMMQPSKAIIANSEAELEQSFKLFSQLANDLTDAYSELQAHVEDLTCKLETVSQERLQELNEKERLANRLQMLVSMLPAAVVVLDGSGIVEEANPAAKELLQDELLGQRWRNIIEQYFSPRADDGHEISLHDGRRVNITTRALGEEPGQIVVIYDMTETRKLQEQLSRDQRLKAIGTMVASLAHQIRTPLTTALLYASHLTESNLEQPQIQKFSQKIMSRLQSIEIQIKDMLLCAKGEQLLFERATLAQILSELQRSTEQTIAQFNCQLNIFCDNKAQQLDCNTEALVGALQNLINNAIDASPSHVEINLTIRNDEQQTTFVVADNGPGIADDLLDKVTEPFFTTRTHGTGLGLDVVRAVVDAHQGSFEIHSQPSIGTCVTLFIPHRHQKQNQQATSLSDKVNEQ